MCRWLDDQMCSGYHDLSAREPLQGPWGCELRAHCRLRTRGRLAASIVELHVSARVESKIGRGAGRFFQNLLYLLAWMGQTPDFEHIVGQQFFRSVTSVGQCGVFLFLMFEGFSFLAILVVCDCNVSFSHRVSRHLPFAHASAVTAWCKYSPSGQSYTHLPRLPLSANIRPRVPCLKHPVANVTLFVMCQ